MSKTRLSRPKWIALEPTRVRTRATSRGYTVIEVMIALALLGVGVGSVIAMEKIATVTNREARNLVVATQIARTWIDRLRVDASAWNHPASALDTTSDRETQTLWLRNVSGAWVRPTDDARGSPAADVFGNDVRNNADKFDERAAFCTNIRLSWMPNGPPLGSLVIRADVRVFWLRQGGGGNIDTNKGFCSSDMDPATITGETARYHFVHLTSGIPQNALQ